MTAPPSTEIQYLHQLAWRPAQFAHPLWLAEVGVKPENYHYGRSQVFDRALNSLLIQRRKFLQSPLPVVLSQQQQRQIAQSQRLPALCLALGVVSLQCHDYLRLRHYRQALSPLLNDADLQQLIGMGCGGQRQARLSPQQLLPVALRLGQSLASDLRRDSRIWQAISILLPPHPRALCLSRSGYVQTAAWLSRLERLL